MKKSKKIVSSAIILAVSAGTLLGAQAVGAANQPGEQTLIDKLAKRFKVDKTQVQEVFDEYHELTLQEDRAEFEQQVDAAVAQGALNRSTANQLISKYRALVAYKESLADKTPEEQYGLMKVKVREFKTWAKQNSVPRGLWIKAVGRGQLLGTERIYE